MTCRSTVSNSGMMDLYRKEAVVTQSKYNPGIYFGLLRKISIYNIEDNRCSDIDSNRAPLQYNPVALPVRPPAQFI
jgi:hypothetical protein